MANLIDTIIKGTARVLGTLFAKKVQTDTLNAPTTSGGSTFGPGSNGQILKSNGTTMYWGAPDSDTKNTAGSTDTSSKIFLIGATSQAANPQTYSHDTAYVGTDGCLYSGGNKVITSYETHATYDETTTGATDLNYVLGTYTD